MPDVSKSAFFKAAKRSKLITSADLESMQAQLADVNDVRQIAEAFVEKELLTGWQARQMRKGRNRFYVGKYKLLQTLGAGGMSVVFLAEQPGTKRIVALKLMSKALLSKPAAVSRFLREIRSVAALNHPNIVAAYDADQVDDTYFLIMEYVKGRDLHAWTKDGQKNQVSWTCECIRQIANGLQHAFEKGIIHRDIKPSNIVVLSEELKGRPQVKILDMGLARLADDGGQNEGITMVGHTVGTVDYMSPEQAQDASQADTRSDIYSLGCTLFELLAGQPPFTGKSPIQKLLVRTMQDAPPLEQFRDDLPPGLSAVVAKMLRRDPDSRFQTPGEVAAALEIFVDKSQSTPTQKPAHAPAESAAPDEWIIEDSEEVDAALPSDLFSKLSSQDSHPSVAATYNPKKRKRKQRQLMIACTLAAVLLPLIIGLVSLIW